MLQATRTQGLPIPRNPESLVGEIICKPCGTHATTQATTPKIPTTKATKTSDAPHVLIDFKSLQDTIDNQLKPCSKCKLSTQRLVQKSRTNFAVTLEIVCDNCDSEHKKLQNQIAYLNKRLEKLVITDNADKKTKNQYKDRFFTRRQN